MMWDVTNTSGTTLQINTIHIPTNHFNPVDYRIMMTNGDYGHQPVQTDPNSWTEMGTPTVTGVRSGYIGCVSTFW